MLLSAMRQRQTCIDTKSSQQDPGRRLAAWYVSFYRHIGRLNGLTDVGHRTGRLGSGGVNEG
jgi:hypothetical protein